jgi:lipoyl(octanoyl) transferase
VTGPPIVRRLGRVDYQPVWDEMRAFTARRNPDTPDELWVVEHPPVYTLGHAGRREHLRTAAGIPVIATDRGGQVTYHGPGQIVAYPLVDLRRHRLSVHGLVHALEDAAIALAGERGITAVARRDAPGVYVHGRKLASVGLRIRRGASYHGLAFNVAMDLEPFSRINPCGMPGLEVTQLSDLATGLPPLRELAMELGSHIVRALDAHSTIAAAEA